MNALGGEQVVHSFNGYSDGANPFGGLIAVHGSLYGTTYDGGRHGKGTVFEINASYEKTVLHDFAGGSDGANPLARSCCSTVRSTARRNWRSAGLRYRLPGRTIARCGCGGPV